MALDAGKGGKFVLTRPEFFGDVPGGYMRLPSSSYEVHFVFAVVAPALLRSRSNANGE
jgi:hypothetical protein